MLDQYKNTAQIQAKNGSVSAERLSQSKTKFLSFDADESIYFNPAISSQGVDSRTEFHVYNNNTWVTANHSVQKLTKIPEYRDKITNQLIVDKKSDEIINILKTYKKDINIKDLELCLKINKTIDFITLSTKEKKEITNIIN